MLKKALRESAPKCSISRL